MRAGCFNSVVTNNLPLFSLSPALCFLLPICQNACLAQLMEQVLEMESLSNQVLRWREVPSSQSQRTTWCSESVSQCSTWARASLNLLFLLMKHIWCKWINSRYCKCSHNFFLFWSPSHVDLQTSCLCCCDCVKIGRNVKALCWHDYVIIANPGLYFNSGSASLKGYFFCQKSVDSHIGRPWFRSHTFIGGFMC